MTGFIINNVYSIVLLLLAIGVLFYLFKTGRKVLVKRILKKLIVKAELYYGTGSGKRKKQYVIKEFYKRAKILGVFLSEREIDTLIELILGEVKEQLG